MRACPHFQISISFIFFYKSNIQMYPNPLNFNQLCAFIYALCSILFKNLFTHSLRMSYTHTLYFNQIYPTSHLLISPRSSMTTPILSPTSFFPLSLPLPQNPVITGYGMGITWEWYNEMHWGMSTLQEN